VEVKNNTSFIYVYVYISTKINTLNIVTQGRDYSVNAVKETDSFYRAADIVKGQQRRKKY
jgi:hypothetical protein